LKNASLLSAESILGFCEYKFLIEQMGYESSLSAAAVGDDQELRRCIEGLDVDRDGFFNRHDPSPPVIIGQPRGIHGRYNRPIPATTAGSMGEAALHKAASEGRYNMCSYLLSAAEQSVAQAGVGGAKVLLRQRNSAGQTPLILACLSGSLETVQLLIDAGSELEAKDDINGYTPLHAAVRNGHVLVAQALLAANADPNSTDNMGGTALHVAARYDVAEAVDLLAGSGCSLDMQRFSDHFTALHLACKHNQKPDTVQALLSAGADPGLTSRAGYPPAYLAMSQVWMTPWSEVPTRVPSQSNSSRNLWPGIAHLRSTCAMSVCVCSRAEGSFFGRRWC
jgi:ankyrin repeat protein